MIEYIIVTQCIISIALIIVVWTGPIAKLRRDNYRSNIRRIRDELFDFVGQNRFDYDDAAYQETRRILNGFIRISNLLSVSFLVHAVNVILKSGESEFQSEVTEMEEGPLKCKLKEALVRATNETMVFIFRKRIRGWLAIAVVRLIPARRTKKVEQTLIKDAFDFGSPNLRGSLGAV